MFPVCFSHKQINFQLKRWDVKMDQEIWGEGDGDQIPQK